MVIEFYTLVSVLALAHLIADYPLQTDWMAENKHTKRWALLAHAIAHGVVAGVLTLPVATLPDVASIAVLVPLYHGLIDLKNLSIRTDQTAHLVGIIVIAAFMVAL